MSKRKSCAFRADYAALADTLKTEITIVAISASPPGKSKVIVAIWDTGATHSVITRETAGELDLTPVDQVMISGVNSEGMADVALVHIILPNNVLVTNKRVTIADIKGADMLIGMDIIGRGDFLVCNSGGKTSFSFVVPPFDDRPDWVEKSDSLNDNQEQ
ncbi:MAG: retroviral-like aspartic protease family protein [Treponema sp.]|jgi:hypothetical protein|nr:retroviral-like aspartic protease family protein [Treponema sp.]